MVEKLLKTTTVSYKLYVKTQKHHTLTGPNLHQSDPKAQYGFWGPFNSKIGFKKTYKTN